MSDPSECYWCKHGWPKPIRDIYGNALDKLDRDARPLLYGPAHVVWEDENFDSAQWCLDHFGDYTGHFTDKQLAIVRESLVQLLAVPDEYKTEPEDGGPPPAHWQCAPREQVEA